MDFDKLNPLEYIAVADEVVYSALLRWLFGADSPLSLDARLRVLERLTGRSYVGCTSTSATTEWKNVDLVVDLEHPEGLQRVAFENKVKAEESPNQLATYDTRLSGAAKIFLTLTGEAPRREARDWTAVSYAALREVIAPEAGTHVYAADYLAMLDRLVQATRLVVEKPETYGAFVFGETTDSSVSNGFARYVTTLRLEKVLQRIWLRAVAAKVIGDVPLEAHWNLQVEGEKQSLMNVETHAYTVGTIGLQFQHGKLKYFARPDGYLTHPLSLWPHEATRT